MQRSAPPRAALPGAERFDTKLQALGRTGSIFADIHCYLLKILSICEFVLRVIKRTTVTNDHNWLITTDSESERSQNER